MITSLPLGDYPDGPLAVRHAVVDNLHVRAGHVDAVLVVRLEIADLVVADLNVAGAFVAGLDAIDELLDDEPLDQQVVLAAGLDARLAGGHAVLVRRGAVALARPDVEPPRLLVVVVLPRPRQAGGMVHDGVIGVPVLVYPSAADLSRGGWCAYLDRSR